ncbi:MAG: DUF6778 family protein [Roseovarius sp.]
MKPLRLIAAMMMGLAVSACATPDTASRNAPLEAPERVAPIALDVQSVTVTVPETLEVSEKNRYYPGGDIVWRGDAPGNRHAQVQALVQTAMERGTADMTIGLPVAVEVEITRFHALSEKARYTVGGVHDIEFILTLKDPVSGAIIAAPREIKADLKAFGGTQAIQAEQRGQTQKVRITGHLAEVIAAELNEPGSFQSANLGIMGLINEL